MSKVNYNQEEWNRVSGLPQLVGSTMASVGKSGFVGSIKEMFKNVSFFNSSRKTYADNPLISDIVPGIEDRDAALSEARNQRDSLIDRVKSEEFKSVDQLQNWTLQDAEETYNLVKEKESPEVATAYKNWLLEIAQEIANAGTEGDILGFGGEKFSEKERAFMEKLQAALV